MNDIFYKIDEGNETSTEPNKSVNISTVSVDSSLFKSNNILNSITNSDNNLTNTSDLNSKLVDIHKIMLDSEYLPNNLDKYVMNKNNETQFSLKGGNNYKLPEISEQTSYTDREISTIFPLALTESTNILSETSVTDSLFDIPGNPIDTTISDKYSTDLISRATTVSTPNFTTVTSELKTTSAKSKKRKKFTEYY
jgi:hypothetical protein